MRQFVFLTLTLAANIIMAQSASNKSLQFRDSVFVINGKINGQAGGYIKIHYSDKNGKTIDDSSAITNGHFQLRGNIKEPTMAYLEGAVKSRTADDPNVTHFFIEPAVIKVSLTFNQFKDAIVIGSRTEDENKAMMKRLEPLLKEKAVLTKQYDEAVDIYWNAVNAKKDEVTISELKYKMQDVLDKFTPYNRSIMLLQLEYFDKHPRSYVTAFNLRSYLKRLTLDSLKLFYGRLAAVQQSNFGKYIANQIEKLDSVSVGNMAKRISSTEINGNPLSLSDYKGKYVLLDFWASWCIPCRRGNPHLKRLYTKYKEQGIEFIGISDDDSADKWRAAVKKDSIGIWKHILRKTKSPPGSTDPSEDLNKKYAILSIPTKILIDKEGKIIGRFDENEGPLDEMLRKIFGH